MFSTVGVFPGEVLYVEVGGVGASPTGGFNGGGDGAATAGGGGGAFDVRTIARANAGTTLPSRLVVAAGGGGAGSDGTCLHAAAAAMAETRPPRVTTAVFVLTRWGWWRRQQRDVLAVHRRQQQHPRSAPQRQDRRSRHHHDHGQGEDHAARGAGEVEGHCQPRDSPARLTRPPSISLSSTRVTAALVPLRPQHGPGRHPAFCGVRTPGSGSGFQACCRRQASLPSLVWRAQNAPLGSSGPAGTGAPRSRRSTSAARAGSRDERRSPPARGPLPAHRPAGGPTPPSTWPPRTRPQDRARMRLGSTSVPAQGRVGPDRRQAALGRGTDYPGGTETARIRPRRCASSSPPASGAWPDRPGDQPPARPPCSARRCAGPAGWRRSRPGRRRSSASTWCPCG